MTSLNAIGKNELNKTAELLFPHKSFSFSKKIGNYDPFLHFFKIFPSSDQKNLIILSYCDVVTYCDIGAVIL